MQKYGFVPTIYFIDYDNQIIYMSYSGEVINDFEDELTEGYNLSVEDSFNTYEQMLDSGVAKEMARMVLPSSTYTEFYFTVDLRNLLHFLELRLHEHAQLEIREFAKGISRILHEQTDLVWTMEIFDEMTSLNYKLQEKLGENISIERMIAALDLLQKD